jgi:hypothetical protein
MYWSSILGTIIDELLVLFDDWQMLDPDTLCTGQVIGISNIQQPASNIFTFQQEREIKFMHAPSYNNNTLNYFYTTNHPLCNSI